MLRHSPTSSTDDGHEVLTLIIGCSDLCTGQKVAQRTVGEDGLVGVRGSRTGRDMSAFSTLQDRVPLPSAPSLRQLGQPCTRRVLRPEVRVPLHRPGPRWSARGGVGPPEVVPDSPLPTTLGSNYGGFHIDVHRCTLFPTWVPFSLVKVNTKNVFLCFLLTTCI